MPLPYQIFGTPDEKRAAIARLVGTAPNPSAGNLSRPPAEAPTSVPAQSVVKAEAAAPPLTARERGVATHQAIGRYFTDTSRASEPARVAALNAKTAANPGVVHSFLGGLFTGQAEPTRPPVATPATPAPSVTTAPRSPAVAVPGYPQGVLRGLGVAPATKPAAIRGLVGPPVSAATRPATGPTLPPSGPGLPPVGTDEVQVIRGTQVTRDRDGLSIPVGLEGEQGRLAAGYRNLGLQGVEIPPAIVDQQNADSSAINAQAAATNARANLIRANTPQFSDAFIPDENDPTSGYVAQIVRKPDGTTYTENLKIRAYRPLNETTAVGEVVTPDELGNQTRTPVILNRQTGEIVGRAGGRQRPVDVPEGYEDAWDAAYERGVQEGLSAEDAASAATQHAINESRRKKGEAASREPDPKYDRD